MARTKRLRRWDDEAAYMSHKTSISIRSVVKFKMGKIATKYDSYENVISMLINENKRLEDLVEKYEGVMSNAGMLPRNVLAQYRRGKSTINISDPNDPELYAVGYEYTIPVSRSDDLYEMSIIVSQKTVRGQEIRKVFGIRQQMDIYWLIVEDIVRKHFDETFIITDRDNPMSVEYWRRMKTVLGIGSEEWLCHDITDVIQRYERGEGVLFW